MRRKVAFLDRDGVINRDYAYVHRWEDFDFVPGAVAAMRRLHAAGWDLVIVTNQSGIARGRYTEAQYQRLREQMLAALAEAGVPVLGVYHCPHHPQGKIPELAVTCDCRKPAPGLLLQAAREHHIDLASACLIGDRPSDIAAGRRAGLRACYQVCSENPESPQASNPATGQGDAVAADTADGVFPDLAACVQYLLDPNGTDASKG